MLFEIATLGWCAFCFSCRSCNRGSQADVRMVCKRPKSSLKTSTVLTPTIRPPVPAAHHLRPRRLVEYFISYASQSQGRRPKKEETTIVGCILVVLKDPGPRLPVKADATPIARASATSWACLASLFRWQCWSLRRCHNSLAGGQSGVDRGVSFG